MHPAAAKELQNKLKKIIESTTVNNGYIDTQDFQAIENAAQAIAKEKKGTPNTDDAISWIYSFLLRIARNENIENGRLSDQIKEIDSTCKWFTDCALELPIPIEISFPLPKLPIDRFKNIQITDTDAFRPLSLFQHNYPSDKEIIYFVTKIKGFCGDNFSSPTLRESLTRLKVVLYALIDNKAAMNGNFRAYNLFSVPPAPSLDAFATYKLGGEAHMRTIELPPQINELMFYLQDYPIQINPDPNNTPKNRLNNAKTQLAQLFTANEPKTRRVFSAAEWYIDSFADNNTPMELIKLCIGLESIYGDNESNGSITESLADRCAYSLSSTHEERENIKTEFKKLYKIRSKIVHGVTNSLTPEDRDHIRNANSLLRRSIEKELMLIKNSNSA